MNSKLLLIALLSLNSVFIVNASEQQFKSPKQQEQQERLQRLSALQGGSAGLLDDVKGEFSEVPHSLPRTASEQEVTEKLKAQTPISQQPSQDKISMGSQVEREKTETSCFAACGSMFCN